MISKVIGVSGPENGKFPFLYEWKYSYVCRWVGVGSIKYNVVQFFHMEQSKLFIGTKDGSVNALPQILYGQYLILGAFGSYMFQT